MMVSVLSDTTRGSIVLMDRWPGYQARLFFNLTAISPLTARGDHLWRNAEVRPRESAPAYRSGAAAAILQKTLLVGPTPREHLVRVHFELAGHSRHRCSRRERRLDDPTLLIHSKTLPPTAFARTPCVQFHRSRINQSNPTNQTGSPDAYVEKVSACFQKQRGDLLLPGYGPDARGLSNGGLCCIQTHEVSDDPYVHSGPSRRKTG
jgi:hypothetical protein